MECVFCRILKGELPKHEVADRERCVAFLDINPATRGHTLVVPKRHVERLSELSEDEAAEVLRLAGEVAEACVSRLGAAGVNFWINQGKVAGQVVPHLHLHVVPRYAEGEIRVEMHQKQAEQGELERVAQELRKGLE